MRSPAWIVGTAPRPLKAVIRHHMVRRAAAGAFALKLPKGPQLTPAAVLAVAVAGRARFLLSLLAAGFFFVDFSRTSFASSTAFFALPFIPGINPTAL